jgi:hypothetical protein
METTVKKRPVNLYLDKKKVVNLKKSMKKRLTASENDHAACHTPYGVSLGIEVKWGRKSSSDKDLQKLLKVREKY